MVLAKDSKLTLACVLITVFLDLLGYGIIIPVLPELITDLTGGSVANAAFIGGWLLFAYALTQFVFSPVLGNLSDRFGRRPVLLLSLLGLAGQNARDTLVENVRLARPGEAPSPVATAGAYGPARSGNST